MLRGNPREKPRGFLRRAADARPGKFAGGFKLPTDIVGQAREDCSDVAASKCGINVFDFGDQIGHASSFNKIIRNQRRIGFVDLTPDPHRRTRKIAAVGDIMDTQGAHEGSLHQEFLERGQKDF